MRNNLKRLGIISIFFALVLVKTGFAEQNLPYLHSIRVENKNTNSNHGVITRVSLFTKNPVKLSQQFPTAKVNVHKDRIDIEYSKYLPTPINYNKRYLHPSFLIDYDEAIFKKIEKEVSNKIGVQVGAEALSNYTFSLLVKTMDRLYDAASIVAAQQKGDCSEHAIFLTAMFRIFKIPAKTVHGIVLRFSKEKNQWTGYGHAWVEYYEDGRWQGIDPTFNQKVDNRYIPNFAIETEDMSSSFYILNQEASYGIEKVVIY